MLSRTSVVRQTNPEGLESLDCRTTERREIIMRKMNGMGRNDYNIRIQPTVLGTKDVFWGRGQSLEAAPFYELAFHALGF